VAGELTVLCRRLERLDTPVVSDVLDELGLPDQLLSAAVKPVDRSMRVAGPAFCIRGEGIDRDAPPPAAVEGSPPGYEMFRHMYAGCVAVVDTGGHQVGGPWGENTALSAVMRGCRGVVIDGGTRDAPQLAAMGFPAFVRWSTAVRVDGRWRHTGFEEPITLPGQTGAGVIVTPGDLVLADADGVAIVPQALAEEVVEAAEEVVRIEQRIRDELVAGSDREAVYRRNPRFAHVGAGTR
jgi:4-hydroxy-4-methyl-2-oxoglutarate aldolase